MSWWQGFITEVKYNFPIALIVAVQLTVIYVAQRIRGEVDNLMLRTRIRERLPEEYKTELAAKDREIEERDKRIAWLETEINHQRSAIRGAMGHLSGLIARGKDD